MKRQYYWLIATVLAICVTLIIGLSVRKPFNHERLRAEADSLMKVADIAIYEDSFTLAFHTLREAMAKYNELGDSANEMNVRSNLSVVYYGIGLYDEASKELDIVQKHEHLLDSTSQLMYYRCRAIIETVMYEDYENAEKNIIRVVDLNRKMNNPVGARQDLANLAEIYIYAGEKEKARKIIKQIEEEMSQSSQNFSSQYYLCKGKLHFLDNHYEDAYEALSHCLSDSTTFYQPHLKLDALNLMCQIDSIHNDKDAYINNFKSHIQLNDSLSGKQITSQIARLQELQKIEIERKTQDKRSKLTIAYLVSAMLVAMLIAFISLLLYRQSKYHQKMKQLEADRLNREIMLQRMQNELLQLKVSQNDEALKDVRQENLSMSLRLASLQQGNKLSESLKTFDDIHRNLNGNFGKKLREQHSNLTTTEQRFLCLIKLGLTLQEMMSVLNISHSGIYKMRYRLKKKLGLSGDSTIEKYLGSFD